MIIENLSGMTGIFAEGDNKITNKQRSFYTDFVYLGKNDSIDNYEEVGYDIWKHFVDEIPDSKVEKLESSIEMLKITQITLGELLLDTDFRLMCLEMGITP